MWQLSFPMTEDDAKILSKRGPWALKEEALKRCGEWHQPIPDLLHSTPEKLVTGYPVYDREILSNDVFRLGSVSLDVTNNNKDGEGNKQSHHDQVTLLGDAAH